MVVHIYKITNKINGDCYIGQTKRSLSQRWKEHCNLKAKGSRFLKFAIAKYGKEAFSLTILDTYTTLEAANAAEPYYIDFHNCLAPSGYNLHSGGNSYLVSEATRQKLSTSHIGQIPSAFNREQSRKANTGRPTWNKGKTGYKNAGSFKKGVVPWNKGVSKNAT